MIKWGNKDMTTLSTSHLINIIKWIDRERLSSTMLSDVADAYNESFYHLYVAAWEAYKSAARKLALNRDADLILEYNTIQALHESDEKKFRKGGWKTQEEFLLESQYDSDGIHILEKHHGSQVEDNDGFDPYF